MVVDRSSVKKPFQVLQGLSKFDIIRYPKTMIQVFRGVDDINENDLWYDLDEPLPVGPRREGDPYLINLMGGILVVLNTKLELLKP